MKAKKKAVVIQKDSETSLAKKERPPEGTAQKIREYLNFTKNYPVPKFDSKKDKSVLEIGNQIAGCMRASGTKSIDASNYLLRQMRKSLPPSSQELEQANGVLALMHGIEPQNELEGMLIAQIALTHAYAMRLLETLAQEESGFGIDSNIARATKFLRLFNNQLDVLKRLRGNGGQTVVVKHVNVNKGGQAIVGNVGERKTKKGSK